MLPYQRRAPQRMRDAVIAVLGALSLAACATGAPRVGCDINRARPWIASWLRAWDHTADTILKVQRVATPEMIFFDTSCVYAAPSGSPQWRAFAHSGAVTMPDGAKAPVGVMSFAAPGPNGPFFAMAAPEVWAAAGVNSDQVGRERLLTGVFLHEFAHTRQIPALQQILDPIEKTWRFPQKLSDDVVQDRFGVDKEYETQYQRERDLLYRAAAADSVDESRALAKEALALIRVRQARWFTGENAVFRVLDDIFLSFEGAGQWVAYAWLVDPRGGGVAKDVAIAAMRRGGRSWTQDEGLALFMLVDRLLPDWPSLVFRPESIGGLQLLERAAGPTSSSPSSESIATGDK
jgi:hypothetical protein